MDEDLEIEVVEDDQDILVEAFWAPESNEQALRWECLKMATKIVPADKAIKLAKELEGYIKDNKPPRLSVVK